MAIRGTGFGQVVSVKFGTFNALSYAVDSGTQIDAVSPPNATQAVNITVTSIVGKSIVTSADRFTYVATPVVDSVTPGRGSLSGGT